MTNKKTKVLAPGDEIIIYHNGFNLHTILVCENKDFTIDVIVVSNLEYLSGKFLTIHIQHIVDRHITEVMTRVFNLNCAYGLHKPYTDFCNQNKSLIGVNTMYSKLFGSDCSSMLCAYRFTTMTQDIIMNLNRYFSILKNTMHVGLKEEDLNKLSFSLLTNVCKEIANRSTDDDISVDLFNELAYNAIDIIETSNDPEAFRHFAKVINDSLDKSQLIDLIKYLEGY